jgi:hypothetical protein
MFNSTKCHIFPFLCQYRAHILEEYAKSWSRSLFVDHWITVVLRTLNPPAAYSLFLSDAESVLCTCLRPAASLQTSTNTWATSAWNIFVLRQGGNSTCRPHSDEIYASLCCWFMLMLANQKPWLALTCKFIAELTIFIVCQINYC